MRRLAVNRVGVRIRLYGWMVGLGGNIGMDVDTYGK
jgi:hypothetical protein